jgi:mono/diheme cytochrome c family protein
VPTLMNRRSSIPIAGLLAGCTLIFASRASLAVENAVKIDFARDIRPLFAKHCFHCHGSKEEEGGLRLDRRQRVLDGGASGPALVPGKSAESFIYQFITGRNEDKVVMPPKGRGERLNDAECELVRHWIDQGAPWPDDADYDAAPTSRRAVPRNAEAPLPINSHDGLMQSTPAETCFRSPALRTRGMRLGWACHRLCWRGQ